MNCRDVHDWLRRDLDGRAEPSADVAAHLDTCSDCREEAGRVQAIAAAARAALPPAAVPADFTTHVMAAIETPPDDAVLERQARPRLRRWAPVLAALLVLPFLPWWRSEPAVEGALRVERDGAWEAAGAAEAGDVFGLARDDAADVGGVRIVALRPSLLKAERPLQLLGGEVVLETRDRAVLKTAPADIVLRPNTICVAALGDDEMAFDRMKTLRPAVLALAVLAGGATLVNAQGELDLEKEERARARSGEAPVRDRDPFREEIDRINAIVAEANAALDRLRKELAQGREAVADGRADSVHLREELAALRAQLADMANERARQAKEIAELRARLERGKRAPLPREEPVRTESARRIAEIEAAFVEARRRLDKEELDPEEREILEQRSAHYQELLREIKGGEGIRARDADPAAACIRTLKDKRATMQARYHAAVQLGGAHQSKRAVEALMGALNDPMLQNTHTSGRLVRRAAAASLGKYGSAPDAVSTLIMGVADNDPYVGRTCHRALLLIAKESGRPAPQIEFDPSWDRNRRDAASAEWLAWWK